MRLSYAIVFVADMARSVAFYRDLVGLPLRFESPHWTEFETEGATLALHAAEAPALPGAGREAPGTCRPGLAVPDLESFHRKMIAHGVRCLEEPATVFGARLAQYEDPDGLALSVSEEQDSG